jgi:dynein heavy chain 2
MYYIFRTDLEHFEMTVPTFELAEEINKDLSEFEAMWFLLEEFNSGLQELAKEDWISFRYVFV